MTFTDTYYPISVATPVKSELARVSMAGARASFATSGLAAGTHLITATHDASGASVTLVQAVHAFATTTTVIAPIFGPQFVQLSGRVAAAVGVPTGLLTFENCGVVVAQLPMQPNGVAPLGLPLSIAGTVTARYPSDSLYASSSGSIKIAACNSSAGPAGENGPPESRMRTLGRDGLRLLKR